MRKLRPMDKRGGMETLILRISVTDSSHMLLPTSADTYVYQHME